jgi:DNA/RNA endonuclease YhcR with UshA esterase domain
MSHRMPDCGYSTLFCFLATFTGYVAILPSAMASVRVVQTIPAEQAQEHIGETNTVCGLIASALYMESAKGNPTFLNFDRPYPNQTFAVMIPGLSRAAFNEPPEVLFNRKTVCVTGLIVDYRGKPEIVVEDPSQIVIQEATPTTPSEPVAKVITNPSPKTSTTASEPLPNTSQKPPAPSSPSATLKGIPSAQAQQHIGEATTVCGLVASARYFESREGGRTLLNFDQPYPNQTLTVLIAGPNRAKFGGAPETMFQGKNVCVTGQIVDYRGKPEIVVENPSQIVIQR